MTDCSNYGDALVGREDDEPRWIHSPEDVHVITELLDDPEAVAFIETRYRIGEPCPVSDAVHAHRIDHNTPVSTPSGPSAGLEGQDATQEPQNATEAAEDAPEWGDVRHWRQYAIQQTDWVRKWAAKARTAEAELEKYKRGGKTLGETIEKQCQMVLDATGRHDLIAEDGDGDWGAVWDHLADLRPRAEAAEKTLRRIREFIAEPWDAGPDGDVVRVTDIRAILGPEQP